MEAVLIRMFAVTILLEIFQGFIFHRCIQIKIQP